MQISLKIGAKLWTLEGKQTHKHTHMHKQTDGQTGLTNILSQSNKQEWIQLRWRWLWCCDYQELVITLLSDTMYIYGGGRSQYSLILWWRAQSILSDTMVAGAVNTLWYYGGGRSQYSLIPWWRAQSILSDTMVAGAISSSLLDFWSLGCWFETCPGGHEIALANDFWQTRASQPRAVSIFYMGKNTVCQRK